MTTDDRDAVDPNDGLSGLALYNALTSASDARVRANAGLDTGVLADAELAVFAQIRARLAPHLAEWVSSKPKVFIYGAGLHTRMLLGLLPELGPHVVGFVDERPLSTFLGKPCIRPEEFHSGLADVVIYSSRAHEDAMHRSIDQVAVDHVPLYGASIVHDRREVSRVARRFGFGRVDPRPLLEMYVLPEWARDCAGVGEAIFLYEMILATQPASVLELGTGAGATAAVVLYGLDQLLDPSCRTLLSVEASPTCAFDALRAAGEAVLTMYPNGTAEWELWNDHTASRCAAEASGRSFDLLVLGGASAHPRPLLNLLHLAPLVRPGAWIVLQGVDCRVVAPSDVDGRTALFDAWPFDKIHGTGRSVNSAALRMPDQLADLVPVSCVLLDRPWREMPAAHDGRFSPALAEVERAFRAKLEKSAETAAA